MVSETVSRTRCGAYNAKQQAAFMEWWREGRIFTLQPRGAEAPTAQEHMDAIRQRIVARSIAVST